MKTSSICMAALLVLTACGGGGSSRPTSSQSSSSTTTSATAEGAYTGTTSISGETFRAFVLENGDIWALYGANSGNAVLVRSFVQGAGTSSKGSYVTSNAKDVTGPFLAVDTALNATYVAGKSFNGSTSSGVGTKTFTAAPIPSTEYNYNAAANLADVTGAWSLTDMSGATVGLNVNSNGFFSGSAGGCQFTGTIVPKSSGKNVFDFTVSFGGSPCLLPGQTANGIAITYLISGTSTRQLIAVGLNQSRTNGTAIFGTR